MYALTRARYHLSLVPIFIFPLLLYVLISLKGNYSTANKVKLFFALLLAFNIHPYYTPMALLMLAVLAACYLVKKLAAGIKNIDLDYRFIRVCLLLCALALLITLPLSYIGIALAKSDTATLGRQEGDLYTYAAHAWNYYAPSPNSYFLGDSIRQFVHDRVLSTNIEEFVLFLGYTNMGLALIAVFAWFTRKKIRLAGRLTEDLESRRWVVPVAAIIAIVFFIWSLPPTIKLGSFTLYLPSWFIYKLVPSIRVYARFGALVFFSVTMLSGACLSFLDKSLAKRLELFRYLFFFLLLALILCEFVEITNAPMQRIYDHEPVYTEVKNLPDDAVIAEYPFVASDEAHNYQYLWNSIFHAKSMLNGYALGTEGEALRNCVLNVFDAKTPGLLAYMGAGYVTVHKDLYAKGSEYSYPRSDPDLRDLPAGYEIVSEDDTSALLKVTAERPQNVVIYDPKFSTVITPDFGNGWWLGAEKKWMVKIDASDDRTVDIRFDICSARGERTLRVDLGLGRTEILRIGEDSREVVIPGVRLKGGINRIYLSTEEDPVPYNEVFGGYDSKGLCFAMSFWEMR